MEGWYSVAELARETNIAEGTVRRYLTQFKPYFISKGGNRAKKYDPSAINVLKRVKELYDSKYETAGVAEVLKSEFPMILSDEGVAETNGKTDIATLATSEDVAELKKMLMEMSQKLSKQEEFNALLIKELADQKKFVNESIENRDQLLLEKFTEKEDGQNQEKAAEPVKEKKSGLLQRLFGK